MKQSRFSDSQIMVILNQTGNRLAVPDVCREHGIIDRMFYKCAVKFGGLDASLIARPCKMVETRMTSGVLHV